MAFFYRPQNRKPPSGPVIVCPHNPLATGIVSCIPFNAGYGLANDIVNPRFVENSGGSTWVDEPSGIANYNWSFSNATTTRVAFSTVSGGFTVGALCYINDVSGAGTWEIVSRASYASESVNAGWQLALSSGTPPLYVNWNVFNNNAFGSYQIFSTSVVSAVGNYVVVGTSDQVGRRNLYINGALVGTGTANPLPLTTTGNLEALNSVVRLYLTVIWARVLSEFEVASFSANPWQILHKTGVTMAFPVLSPVQAPRNLTAILGPVLAQ